MAAMVHSLLPLLVLSLCSSPTLCAYQKLGSFKTSDPAFLQIFPTGSSDPDALWITSFSGFAPGKVKYIPNIQKVISQGISHAHSYEETVDGNFLWPNLISYVPAGTIKGASDVVAIVPDGFLVPGKGTGGLYVIQRSIDSKGALTMTKGISLVAPISGWFYHMVVWKDLNGDGLLDIITARAKSNLLLGNFDGQLLWLQQPSSNPLGQAWTEHVLAKGPDVLFAVYDFNAGDGLFEVYAAEFFGNALSVFEISTGANVRVTSSTVIEKLASPYDIHILDLDNDGQMELLITEHLDNAGGNVTAYTIPKNYMSAKEYKKFTLSTGYNVTEGGSNQAAPGFVTPFLLYPSSKAPPSILVAGDGSQSAYLMTETSPFTYKTELIENVNGVVGIVPVANIGSKGIAQFFVPNYDGNEVTGYTFV